MKTTEASMLKTFLESIAKECTGKLGYAVARNIRILTTELTEFENEREKLIRKYGKQNGDQIIIENGSKEYFEFLEEMKEFEDIELNFELMKVSQELLENSNLTADKMYILINYLGE